MITLVKVNVLTDDDSLPIEFKERLTALLQELAAEDPEGAEHARVVLEWKLIQPRAYMQTLQIRMGAETIKAPAAKKPAKRATR